MSQGVNIQYCDPQGFARQLNGQFIGGKYSAVTLNSASGTTPATIITFPAGMYGFIWGIQFTIDPIVTIAGAGMNSINVNTVTGAETVAMLRYYAPASAASPALPTVIRETSAPGAFFACSKTGDTVQASNNVALTGGSIRVSFNYGYSNVPIGN